MIPTILIVAVPLGIVFQLTSNRRVLAIGSIVTFLGWWVLVIVVGGVEITLVVALVASALALVNLVVGFGIGWVGARLARRFLGLT